MYKLADKLQFYTFGGQRLSLSEKDHLGNDQFIKNNRFKYLAPVKSSNLYNIRYNLHLELYPEAEGAKKSIKKYEYISHYQWLDCNFGLQEYNMDNINDFYLIHLIKSLFKKLQLDSKLDDNLYVSADSRTISDYHRNKSLIIKESVDKNIFLSKIYSQIFEKVLLLDCSGKLYLNEIKEIDVFDGGSTHEYSKELFHKDWKLKSFKYDNNLRSHIKKLIFNNTNKIATGYFDARRFIISDYDTNLRQVFAEENINISEGIIETKDEVILEAHNAMEVGLYSIEDNKYLNKTNIILKSPSIKLNFQNSEGYRFKEIDTKYLYLSINGGKELNINKLSCQMIQIYSMSSNEFNIDNINFKNKEKLNIYIKTSGNYIFNFKNKDYREIIEHLNFEYVSPINIWVNGVKIA